MSANNDKNKDNINIKVVKDTTAASTILQVMLLMLSHTSIISSIFLLMQLKKMINFVETIKAYNSEKKTSEHHALSAFRKLYDNKLQYGGKKSTDSFDYKFLLWINYYHIAKIPGDTLFIIFPKMLKNAARDYFYTNIYKDQMSIASICYIIKCYFKIDICCQNI